LNVEITVGSIQKPIFELFLSGSDGSVGWQEVSPVSNLTLQDGLSQIFMILVCAIVAPGIISLIPVLTKMFSSPLKGKRFNAVQVRNISFGLSRLVLFGLVLAMITPAKSIIARA
jgi:hypothetical protein